MAEARSLVVNDFTHACGQVRNAFVRVSISSASNQETRLSVCVRACATTCAPVSRNVDDVKPEVNDMIFQIGGETAQTLNPILIC